MKIIRALWGDYNGKDRITARRSKMDDDIVELKKRYQHPWTMLTFGKENTEFSKSNGFDTLQIHDNPTYYHPIKETYIHKIYAIKCAFETWKEPILFLDLDCLPKRVFDMKELEKIEEKSPLSANLMIYRHAKCWWRTENQRILLNGGFLFVGDVAMVRQAYFVFDIFRKASKPVNNDEPIWQYIMDRQEGLDSPDEWLQRHEPTGICSLNKYHMFPNNNTIFRHYLGCKHRRFNY